MAARSRKQTRAKQRGAAMAEGAVILPVLAIFFGLMMYIHNAYLAKATIQSETRFRAFANAAHACMEGDAFATADVVGPDVGRLPVEGNAPDEDKVEALETAWLITRANTTKVAVALGRSRKVSAESQVYCNPKTPGEVVESAMSSIASGVVAAGVGVGGAKAFKFVTHAFQFVAAWAKGTI